MKPIIAITIIAINLLFAFTIELNAQTHTSPFEALRPLAGNWEGTATMFTQSGKSALKQTEHVELKLNENIAVIHGRGFNKTSNELEFEAYALAHWDETSQKYIIDAHTLEGRDVRATMELEPGKLIWGFEVPNQGFVRYEIIFTETTWKETGQFSRDGKNWFTTVELDLKKI